MLATYLQDEVIGEPAKATENEKLPLVRTHANVQDSLVDDLGLAFFLWLDSMPKAHQGRRSRLQGIAKRGASRTIIGCIMTGSRNI